MNIKSLFLVVLMIIPVKAESPATFTAEQLQNYLSQVSSMLVGRPINSSEVASVAVGGQNDFEKILQSWINSEFFAQSAKIMLQTQLGVSGKDSTTNFDLPGNLMKYLIQQNLPYSEIITADYCVADNMSKINCDSGAPYAAGVLTTKAYLRRYRGTLNLSRANNLMRQFACKSYPLDPSLQIPIKSERLTSAFRLDQQDGAAQFGNGTKCYSCHSQFGAHAQLFVKFDAFGTYRAEATGIKSAVDDGTYSSHLVNPAEAAAERSQMFGRDVANLREAALVLIDSVEFSQCAVRNSMQHFLRLHDVNPKEIDSVLLTQIASLLQQNYGRPTMRQITFETLRHPIVIASMLMSGETP